MSDPTEPRSRRPVRADLHRLAERLRLDAVGLVSLASGRPDVTWWAAPESAPLPARLDDVLAGAEPGWIVCHLPDGAAVFGRRTDTTPPRAADVLQAVGANLLRQQVTVPLAAHAGDQPLPHQTPQTNDKPSEGTGELPDLMLFAPRPEAMDRTTRDRVRSALKSLADDTGFDTARLFARAGASWELVEWTGSRRPWHDVLDPSTLGRAAEPAVHRDVRAAPGVGMRLSALGCGSVAILPLGDVACVVLDSSERSTVADVATRAVPYLALITALSTESEAGARAQVATEMAAVERAASAIRGVLEDESSTVTDLFRELREAMDAHEVFHLVERRDEVQAASDTESGWPRRIPEEIRATMRSLPLYGPVDEATARQLGLVLGAVSPHLSAAFGRESSPQEALIAGWREGPGLSHAAMRAVAAMAGGARVAVESRRRTVDNMLTRERTRWADQIHDGLTQAVTTAVLELEAMERQIARDPRRAIESLSATKTEIRRALADLRTLLFDLQRDDPPDSSTAEPLTKYVSDVVKRWRLPARVSIEGDLREVPKPLLGAAYVVIREGLANAAKHAAASKVSVWVNATPEDVTVEVADTGRGFDVGGRISDGGPTRHFGLGMMTRRVEEVGGTLNIESEPGKGTRLVARLPVRGGAT